MPADEARRRLMSSSSEVVSSTSRDGVSVGRLCRRGGVFVSAP